jgi:hypothetical protein
MRLHIQLDDQVVADLDARVGPRRRSAFIAAAVSAALEDERRWDDIEASIGAIGEDHEWDGDPSGWVRSQRRGDTRRVG